MNAELRIGNSAMMARCREALEAFRRRYPSLYTRLFLGNAPVVYRGELLNPASELGLLFREGHEWWSPYIVNAFQGLFIVTDPFTLPDQDRIFSLSKDESLLLARKLKVRPEDVVLDIGTGSGIYALCAARKAKHVVATDINSKALSYARFNAALNGLEHKIEGCAADVFQSLDSERFDLIVSDPPVIPTPSGSGFFTHSDGGPLGASVSTRVLREAIEHLKPGGRIQMLCTSFSDGDGGFLLLRSIREYCYRSSWKFRVYELYNPPLQPISKLTEEFTHVPSFQSWKRLLEFRRCKKLHYLYIDAVPGKHFTLEHRMLPRPLHCNGYSGSWDGRFSRLFLAYRENITRSVEPRQTHTLGKGKTYDRFHK